MTLYRSLPPRPIIDDLEAAISVIQTSISEEKLRLDAIAAEVGPPEVPPELFSVLREVRKTTTLFRTREQTREAVRLVELDGVFGTLDGLVQRASELVSGSTRIEKRVELEDPVGGIGSEVLIGDERLIQRKELVEGKSDNLKVLVKSSSTKGAIFSTGEANTEKLSLIKVAALIETSAKNGLEVLDLQGKLMDNIEWIPVSLGKLSNVMELNLSENRIMAIPTTICNLRALTKLDLHSNQLINLPDSFGELLNLIDLDIRANWLKSLPSSFGNLTNIENLDLSSNKFTQLPNIIGNLTSLKRLNAETNELEELPYTIGSCSSLVELRLDFNELKGLPEAIGKLESLEIFTLHYNRIRGLPTTMGNLSSLREFDVSFNEVESIPESLCLAINLRKLNLGKNFADLRALPKSIGNLEMLEELDISDDQIRVLPDSFRFLSNLRVFRADETPLEMPPRDIVKLGAQAVVQYMGELIAKTDTKSQQPKKKKKKGFWSWICPLFWR